MGASGSQEPRLIVLPPPDRTLGEEFSNIRGIRELADGRVLITDLGDNRLVVADFARGTVRSVGRIGAGPGEVRHFGRLFALSGDSTLLTDEPDGRRWLVLSGDSIVATVPADDPLLLASSGAPRGTDQRGNIVLSRVYRQVRSNQRSGFRLLDSVVAVTVDRRTLRSDTLGRLLHSDQRVEQVGTREQPGMIVRQAHLSSVESVSIAPDGWIALVTHRPFRVTWRTPDGRIVRGSDLAWPEIAVDARERRAHAARVERISGYPLRATEEENWASFIPPFGGAFPALHAPDGSLLLRKMPRSGAEGTRYDVIDRTGRIIAQLVLSERTWLVGFGARSVYSVTRDADGFQRLSRHSWPTR
jgi:hypothetical protein